DRQPDEQNRDTEDTNSHADAGASQALVRGGTWPPAAITIVPAAESAAMRDLTRTAASQLWLALYLNVVADDRHKQLRRRPPAVQADGSSCMRKSGSIPRFSVPGFLYS